MTVAEPPVISALRAVTLTRDNDYGVTVIVPASARFVWRILRIRPELLSEDEDGERVYRVKPKQAKCAIALWDEAYAQMYQDARST